jgi:hypothetical protein
MNNWEKDIEDFNKSQKDSVLGAIGNEDIVLKVIVNTSLMKCLKQSEDKEDFLKGFGADLEKKFPNGSWKTVGGSKVFVNNGKVIAGLDGFNKEIDSFFDKKKEPSSDAKPSEITKKVLNSIKKESPERQKEKVSKFEKDIATSKKTLETLKNQLKNNPGDKDTLSGIKKYNQSIADKQFLVDGLKEKNKVSIGLKYTSGRGEKMEVVGKKSVGSEDFFEVVDTSKEKPLKDLMSKQDIKDELEFSKKQLPQLKEREKQDKIQNKKEKENKKEFDNIDGFGDNLSSMELGKVKQDLNKKINIQGKGMITRKEYVKDKLKDGYEVNVNVAGQRVLMSKDGSWVGNKNFVNKTVLDYAEHLSKKEASNKTPTLDTFKDIAKESKNVDELMSKIRDIKNVPPIVADEFSKKYNPDGKLTQAQAASKMWHDQNPQPKEKEVTSDEKAYFKENKKELMKIISEDPTASISSVIEDHKKEKEGKNAGEDIDSNIDKLRSQYSKSGALVKTLSKVNLNPKTNAPSQEYYDALEKHQSLREDLNRALDIKRDLKPKVNADDNGKSKREYERAVRENMVTSQTHERWLNRMSKQIDNRMKNR